MGIISISGLTGSWASSTLRLCLIEKPKARTCWKLSLWMAGSQHDLESMDNPTLVILIDSLQLNGKLIVTLIEVNQCFHHVDK